MRDQVTCMQVVFAVRGAEKTDQLSLQGDGEDAEKDVGKLPPGASGLKIWVENPEGDKESTEDSGALAACGLLEIGGTEHFDKKEVTCVKCQLRTEKSQSGFAGRVGCLGKISLGAVKGGSKLQRSETESSFMSRGLPGAKGDFRGLVISGSELGGLDPSFWMWVFVISRLLSVIQLNSVPSSDLFFFFDMDHF